jgi:hypothetical protein
LSTAQSDGKASLRKLPFPAPPHINRQSELKRAPAIETIVAARLFGNSLAKV